MTTTRLALLALLAACAPSSPPATSIAPLMSAGASLACAPDDGLDDRTCLQAELDAICAAGGGSLTLPPGTWNLTRPASIPGSRDSADLWVECPIHLSGIGATLMMTGDGFGQDRAGVRVASGGVEVSDITIASDASFNPNEQTHLLFFGAVASAPRLIEDVAVRRVTLRHPVRPEVSGDCLRFLGEAATPIRGVVVEDVVFEACDRSGLAMQRAVEDFTHRDSVYIGIGKTGIDMEPSGQGPIRRVLMSNLYLVSSGISISGNGGANGAPPVWAEDVTLERTYVGGRVGVTYSRGVRLVDVDIAETAKGAEGSLMIRGSEGVTVERGTIRRRAGSVAGPAIKMVGTNGTFPTGVRITGTAITSEIAGSVVDIESAQDVTIRAAAIVGADAASGAGVAARATGRDVAGLRLLGNRVAGMAYAVRLAGGPLNVLGAIVAGGSSTGAGIRCENPTKITAPIVDASNTSAGAATSGCAGATVQSQGP